MTNKYNPKQIKAGLDISEIADNQQNLSISFDMRVFATPEVDKRTSTDVTNREHIVPKDSNNNQNGYKSHKISITKLTRPPQSLTDHEVEAMIEEELRYVMTEEPKKNNYGGTITSIEDSGNAKSHSSIGEQSFKSAKSGKSAKSVQSVKSYKSIKSSKDTKAKSRRRGYTQKNFAGYFVQDPIQGEEDPLRIKEFDINFKYTQFLEFLFYHFVFFFLLGPFSFIILFPTAGKVLTKNMGFFGLNVMFVNQSIQWALLFSSAVLWISTDHGYISAVEVYMIASAVFLRICTISSKYGSMHSIRIKVLKSRYLTYEELTQDYMLIKWRDQTDDVIEQELLAAAKRHDIETSLFFFNFIAKVSDELRMTLMQTRKGVAEVTKQLIATEFLKSGTMRSQDNLIGATSLKHGKSEVSIEEPSRIMTQNKSGVTQVFDEPSKMVSQVKSSIIPNLEKMDGPKEGKRKKTTFLTATLTNVKSFDMLSGMNLAREVVFESKKKGIPRILHVAIVIGFIRALIPMINRVYNRHSPVGTSTVQVYMAISYLLCNTYFFAANLAFVLVGLSDLMKKYYLMSQLSNLLSVRKLEEYETVKKYPTLNIFDPFTLRTWISLRKIFMDFGRKYFLRINLNISIFLIFYAIILIVLLLQYFEIMTIISDTLLAVVFLFEAAVMFGLMIRSVIIGAQVNDHFRVHQSILQKNKGVVADLLQLDDIYFPASGIPFRSANILYQEGVRKIQTLIELAGMERGTVESAFAIEDFLRKLMTLNNNAIEELNFEQESNPVKILGFVANGALVQQILVGLFTLAVAVLQKQV